MTIQKFVESRVRLVAAWWSWRRVYARIQRHAHARPDFFFVQVGSNDGVRGDPIHRLVRKYRWRGILIEPVEYLFEKLKENYRNVPGLIFENVAIDERDGVRSFYRIERTDLPGNPEWYDQVGSFEKHVVMRHRNAIPNFHERLVVERVAAVSLSTLLRKHHVGSIDLLQIDAEGSDYQILRATPFSTIKPAMILYEHRHLSRDDRQACRRLLNQEGYRLIATPADTFAFLM